MPPYQKNIPFQPPFEIELPLQHCPCFVSWKRFQLQQIFVSIHSKSGIPWILESADNVAFSEERLSENEKTISLSTLRLSMLNKGQQVLKGLAQKPNISD